uniref:Uncharacterized protein n=1 Tax=Ananas comosus var. bracteatus TaxID=296719 RepID=A0A6V7PIP0_ANACO|nr:unnamed protein product [Ananas comosus var. bracteatus]
MAFLFLSMLVLQPVDSRPTVDDNLVVTSNNGTSLLEGPKIGIYIYIYMPKHLRGCVRGAVQQEPEEQDVQEDVRHLLLQVQLRAAGTGQDTRGRCPCYDAMRNPAGRP